MKTTIIGAGFVGLTTAAIIANSGHEVVCVDTDPNKVSKIKNAESYFFEPGLQVLTADAVKSGRLTATVNYKEALENSELVFVCVGTPQGTMGEVDLSNVYSSCKQVAQNLSDGQKVELVIKSTVPPGTANTIRSMINDWGDSLSVVSSPEFLSEGRAILDTLFPERIIIGTKSSTASGSEKTLKIYKDIELSRKNIIRVIPENRYTGIYASENKSVKSKIFFMSNESAELVKVSANSFLATKISFANTIARICDQTGANINQVMEAMGSDKRIGRDFLYAGIGWGGGCFPKDVAGMIHMGEELGVDMSIIKGASVVNSSQVDYLISKLGHSIGNLDDKNITVLGLSFKPGTSDIRVSPSLILAEKLIRLVSVMKLYDPAAMDEVKVRFYEQLTPEYASKVSLANNPYDAAKNADAIIIATDWPEILDLDFDKVKSLMKGDLIIDGRNKLDMNAIKNASLRYIGIGR